MKYLNCLKFICCLLLISCLLSGCGFRVSSSIDDLISPVSPFGDNADIKSALEAYAANGYSLKAPDSGEFITSYNFYDINGDGTEEAVAFYEPSDNLGVVDMAVIVKEKNEWRVAENLQSEGREVHSLSFDDLTGDGKVELIVCWDIIPNSTGHELCVYSYEEDAEQKLVQIGKSITVNHYIAENLYGDEVKELLLLEINSNAAKAEMYSLKNNRFSLISETKLDAHITSYDRLQTESVNGEKRVYADAVGSDGLSMLTEIIYWSDAYESIISPFYSYYSGYTRETTRSMMLASMDINDDGAIEIPTDYQLSGLPDGVCAVDWCVFRSSVLMHSAYALFVQNDGYFLVLPENMIDAVSVSYHLDRRELYLTNGENEKLIVSVLPVLKATYSEDAYRGYQQIAEASGYLYLARLGDDEQLRLSLDEWKQYFKTVN